MSLLKYLMVVFWICMYAQMDAQILKINEALSVNTIHLDEDGDSPDWFELYNASGSDLDLENWGVTDDLIEPQKWILPSHTLSADEYLLIWASGKDRREISFSQSILKQGDSFKYLIPDASHDKDWYKQDFDDSSWEQGRVGIGYGDEDDATEVPSGTKSIFLRQTFEINEVKNIVNLVLDVDYDDSFVAYINDVEVARANIGGQPPPYNAAASDNHEAVLYSSGQPERFIIQDLSQIVMEGENVLSIQVHNVSSSSSDLTMIPFLSAELSKPNQKWSVVPSVIDLPSKLWHTNFKLSGGEETLYLFDPQAVLIDSLELFDSPINTSVGCAVSSNDIRFFNVPTPGLQNVTTGYDGILDTDILFSNEGGEVESFELELSVNETSGEIRYTLNNQLPTESSTLYEQPISINENTVVRARYFRDGYLSTTVNSRTYIINTQHDLPIVSLITEPSNLYNSQTGIYVRGNSAESDFPFFGSNFWEDWERPVHFSFYDEDGTLGEATNAGIKIFGGWSRGFDQKSFSLFARKEYGDGSFKYPFFPELSYKSFEALILRNSGNDWNRTMLRDATQTSLMEDADLEYQAYRPTVVYLNGSYFGIYNMREKINEHFIASKNDLDPDSIDILELDAKIIKGSNDEYVELIDYVSTRNLASENAYSFVQDRVDIDNFALYYAAQIYFDNTDWPGNNIKYWKHPGGKWRWVLFDTDFGFGIWDANNFSNNTLQFALRSNGPGWPNPPWSTLLFRQLNQNVSFQHVFINQMADAMNSRFKSDHVSDRIEENKSRIASEMERHFTRWRGRFNDWAGHIQNMKKFAAQRSKFIKDHIIAEYKLPSVNELTLLNNNIFGGYLTINNRIQVDDSRWNGDYFATVPISITAIPKPGYSFSHWEGDISSNEKTISVNVTRPMDVRAVFDQEGFVILPIIINEINYKSNKDFDTGDWIELYNTTDITIDLSNWEVIDADENIYVIPQGTALGPDAYLVMAASVSQFQSLVPSVSAIGDLGFGLSSKGDEISLYNHVKELQDRVIYTNSEPWPEDANGVGYTLELINPDLDNSNADNWNTVNESGSPGQANTMSTSVLNLSDKESLHVYPVPTLDKLHVDLSLHGSSQVELSLVGINGQLYNVLSQEQLHQGNHEFTIDMSAFPVGLYVIQLQLNGVIYSLKCIKSK